LKLLPHEIAALVADAIRAAQNAGDLPPFDLPTIDIRPPKRPEQGDYAAAVALQLAKPARLNPFEIATKIANHLTKPDYISAVEVAHPGYINFRLDDNWLRQQVETIIAEGERLFQLDIGAGKRAQVEFVSANPTAPLHVGRSRGAMVGDTMARVLEAAGYSVEREYYFNNAGAQMRNLGNSLRIRYLQALGKPVTVEDEKTFYQGEYLIDIARRLVEEQGDALAEADWQPFKEYAEKEMFGIIRKTLERVNIHHDVFFNENSLYDSGAVWDTLAELERLGYVYRAALPEDAAPEEREEAGGKGEATWFRSTSLGDQKDRVLVKNSGEPTYTLPDIAYHKNKLNRGFDLLVNVLGADHGTQYKVVQRGVKALGMDETKIHVIIVQLVRLIRGGELVKMSSRAGNIETLDDLIDQTSPDVARYVLLARSADSHLDFDLDLAVKQSNENPVYYIQNAHVRCAGIFREAALRGLSDEGADVSLLGEAELGFIRKALMLGEEIEAAATYFEPHRIAFYALELARTFHPIYDTVRALHSEVPPDVARARLRFYRAAQVVFRRALDILGMSAPEMM
jgi:arginyl-tRNA synthetase